METPCHAPEIHFLLFCHSTGVRRLSPAWCNRFVPLAWCWLSWSQVADYIKDAPEQITQHGDLHYPLFVRFRTVL